jgi:hypothetical protein
MTLHEVLIKLENDLNNPNTPADHKPFIAMNIRRCRLDMGDPICRIVGCPIYPVEKLPNGEWLCVPHGGKL